MKINAINHTYLNTSFRKRTKNVQPQPNLPNVDFNSQPISKANKNITKTPYGQLLKPMYIHAPESRFPESCLCYNKNHYTFIQKNKETGYVEFKKELNPTNLPIAKGHFKGYKISNFHNPSGSIAIQTRLNSSISTSGLFQCAAVAFVDRKNNLQTLLHLCPTADKQSNLLLLDYLISNCENDNLEISIVAGCDTYTDDTITLIMNFINKNCPNSKVNFMNYPNPYDDELVLHNGNLECIDDVSSNFETIAINPYGKIIYA